MFFASSSFNQSLGDWDISGVPNMGFMLASCGMDCDNYDATLIGWEAQAISGLTLSANGLNYDAAQAAHTSLTSTYGWTIGGDTYMAGCNSSGSFIATFKTDNPGGSSNTSITVPITSASGVSSRFSIMMENLLDAGESTIHTVGFTHDFGVVGTYTIRIVGNLDRITYSNTAANDPEKDSIR